MSEDQDRRLELRITDCDPDGKRIQLELVEAGTIKRVRSAFESPLTEGVAQLLAWYFCETRTTWLSAVERCERAERSMLDLGQALGHRLVDEDYALLQFAESVSRVPDALRVRVVSDRPAFFETPWELIMLPESKFLASASARGFVRTLPDALTRRSEPRQLGLGPDAPVRILRVVSRPREALEGAKYRALSWQTRTLGLTGVEATVLINPTPDAVREAILAPERAPHIVHWDGPMSTAGDGCELTLYRGTEQPLTAWEHGHETDAAFLTTIARSKVDVLVLDPTPNPQPQPTGSLHALAARALQLGIENVLAFSHRIAGADSEACIELVYAQLTAGLSLERAVTETRKTLQRRFVEGRHPGDAEESKVRPAQRIQVWPTLLHYSMGDVVFFSAPALPATITEHPRFIEVHASMFGFNPALLPPAELAGGEADAYRLWTELRARALPVLVGRGRGTSTTLHRVALALLLEGRLDAAFYWDLRREEYSPTDAWQMIAGALEMEEFHQTTRQQVLDRLKQGRYLLLFDGMDPGPGSRALLAFATEAWKSGSQCVIGAATRLVPEAGESRDASGELSQWQLQGLTQSECVELADRIHPLPATESGPYDALLRRLRPSPLLVSKAVALCRHVAVTELAADEALPEAGDPDFDVTTQFYAWRLATLPPHWQTLLVALKDLSGVYLEMLQVAIDRPGRGLSEAGSALWKALELPQDTTFADAIAAWDRAGLLALAPRGRCLDEAARPLLQHQAHASGHQRAPQPLQTIVARVVCEGLVTLLRHKHARTDVIVLRNLVANRRLWAQHTETLWFAGEYGLALQSMSQLNKLLVEVKLEQDFTEWALSMLERSDPTALCADAQGPAALAWLTLALHGLLSPAAARSSVMEAGLELWLQRTRAEDFWERGSSPPLITVCIEFLQRALDQRGDYTRFRILCENACLYYERTGDHGRRIAQLKALAACEHELRDQDACHATEQRLLKDIPYDQLPEGTRVKVTLDLAAIRLRRGDLDGAERMLEAVEPQEGLEHLTELLWCELEMRHAHYAKVAPRLCALWAAALRGRQQPAVIRVGQLLLQLQQELGKQPFDAVYEQVAGDAPRPEALGIGSRPPSPAPLGIQEPHRS